MRSGSGDPPATLSEKTGNVWRFLVIFPAKLGGDVEEFLFERVLIFARRWLIVREGVTGFIEGGGGCGLWVCRREKVGGGNVGGLRFYAWVLARDYTYSS